MKIRESMWWPDRMYKEALGREEEALPVIAEVRAGVAQKLTRAPLQLLASAAVLAVTEAYATGDASTNVGRAGSALLAFCAMRNYLYAHAGATTAHHFEDPEACRLALDFQDATQDVNLSVAPEYIVAQPE